MFWHKLAGGCHKNLYNKIRQRKKFSFFVFNITRVYFWYNSQNNIQLRLRNLVVCIKRFTGSCGYGIMVYVQEQRLRIGKFMKKIILSIAVLLLFCPKSYAQTDNIALLTEKGFFERPQSSFINMNPCEEIRKTMYMHVKYANTYNFEGLKALYADNYVNSDGLGKDIYFDLIKKTWDSYPDIKYKADIKNIEINQNLATVEVIEDATATTDSKSGIVNEKGLLQSTSTSVYYLEKINSEWLITSDHIISEKTFLRYGSAKELQVDLIAPHQILANANYTSSLKIEPPKDSLIIASIGQEKITYPQITAEEVFRRLPEDGILERVFKANDKNINEYAVASFGITKAEVNKGTEIKIYVTGLGFVMSRINVIPKNEFIKVAKNDKPE